METNIKNKHEKLINLHIKETTEEADTNELEILYRIYNFLIQVTNPNTNTIHLSKEEIKQLNTSFTQVKITLVKSINEHPNKMKDFLSLSHIKKQ